MKRNNGLAKIKNEGRLILEGVKDVFKMSPKQLADLNSSIELEKKDPEFRENINTLRRIKYQNRLIRKDVQAIYGDPSKKENKARGTQSSTTRRVIK